MPNTTASTNENMKRHFFRASAADFKKIPGSPIAYWVSERMSNCYVGGTSLGSVAPAKLGMRTGDNAKWLRRWFEVSIFDTYFSATNADCAKSSGKKWFPYNKGGEFRRWYGNNEYVVYWENNGFAIKEETLEKYPQLSWDNLGWKITNEPDFFKPLLTWSFVSSSYFGVRTCLGGALFDVGGSSAFPRQEDFFVIAGFLGSCLAFEFLKLTNPTLNFQVVNVNGLPWCGTAGRNQEIELVVQELIYKGKNDWDSYETSWDFSTLPLLQSEYHQPTLKDTYTKLREHWQEMTLEMQRLEEENNRIFIDAYGLQDELTPDVPLEEITLTCNPHYRYGKGKTDQEYETLLLTDTMKELLSYSVGCMMGRYSLDEAGLVYADSQNEGFDHQKYKTFPADDDGIVPIMDMDWFEDDAAKRFVEFIKTAWTSDKLNENLKFIADIINPKSNESPENIIRQYFSISFFKDHLRTYKKRPIYWLFSSGKQKAFEALVYLHRYNESTLARMRANYVTPLQGNINARIEFMEREKNASAAASSQRKIQKEIDTLKKKQLELKAFDDELRHFADMKISLDLDDGVKVNYSKFGNLLADKKVVAGDN